LLGLCLARDCLELVERAVEDGWNPDSPVRGDWQASQVADFHGAHSTANWLRNRETKQASSIVFAVSEVDRAPQAVATNLNREARFFDAPFLGQGVEVIGVISRDGTLLFARVARSPNPVLSRFITAAMSQWRFRPALKNGQQVPVHARITVTFEPDPKRRNGPSAATVAIGNVDAARPRP
jgi:TonB family protein